jgi:hypothetical protein
MPTILRLTGTLATGFPLVLFLGCQPVAGGATRRPATNTSEVTLTSGWSFTEDTIRSEMDDRTRLTNQSLLLFGKRSIGTTDSSEVVMLSAACDDHKLRVSFHFGSEMDEDQPLRFRLDSAPVETLSSLGWSAGNVGGVSLARSKGRSARRFLKRLEGATWLRLEYQPKRERVPSTVRFKVAGLGPLAPKLYASCP